MSSSLIQIAIILWAGGSAACEFEIDMSEACAAELETVIIRDSAGAFRKDDAGLEILAGTKKVLFSQATGQLDNTEVPYVVSILHPSDLFVVWIFGWEWRTVKLVNIKNGDQFSINGFPVSSPDNRRVLVYSEAIESNYYPNILRVYRLERGALILELSLDGDMDATRSWGPETARWIDSRSVEFVRAEWGDGKRVTSVRKLQLGKTGWELL